MRLLIVLMLAFFIASCTNSTTSQNTAADSNATMHNNITDTIVTNIKPILLSGCYQMMMKKDTATMEINLQDSTITGTLNYLFYEKDKNRGTIKGVIRGEYIFADYTFASEGSTSVREVAFKIEDGTLIPGFGDLVEKERKLVFTNKNNLQFQHENPFLKVSCTK